MVIIIIFASLSFESYVLIMVSAYLTLTQICHNYVDAKISKYAKQTGIEKLPRILLSKKEIKEYQPELYLILRQL
jgi:hypothetical protein